MMISQEDFPVQTCSVTGNDGDDKDKDNHCCFVSTLCPNSLLLVHTKSVAVETAVY